MRNTKTTGVRSVTRRSVIKILYARKTMKVIPVRKYASPDFPTRSILDEHPELLRLVPDRWQRNPVVLAALTGVCLLIFSSRALSADNAKKPVPRIAPIFQHGDGRGAFGCEAINPPVFLSEDEARQVIIEEGKRVGIKFSPDSLTLKGIKITDAPSDPPKMAASSVPGTPAATGRIPLTLDGTDPKRKISFEYVSESDVNSIMGEPNHSSSVYSVDTLTAAKMLRSGIKNAKPAGTYAVFYDPMSDPPSDSSMFSSSNTDWREKQAKGNAAAMKASREQLRAQVKDFIVWLKAQGVI